MRNTDNGLRMRNIRNLEIDMNFDSGDSESSNSTRSDA